MTVKYRLGREDAQKMFPEVHKGRTALLDELKRRRRKADLEGPCSFKKAGKEWTAPKNFTDTLAVANKRLAASAKNDDRDRFYFRFHGSDTTFRIQEVTAPTLADPPAGAVGFWHPAVVTAYRVAFGDEFKGQTEFWGAYNCRRNVLNQSIWSMHSDWPPVLAIDIGCTPSVAERLKVVIKREAPVEWVFVYHFGHLHAQVGGNRSGTPRCA